ncbi:hypothetical protein PCL_10940 [Purpureocillium lilacinum]|uniref:Uncharacterized protein n=1 Tax=Purpureocillium lilacinum TaxID=33203 RepID=A0A2U3ECS3_PURLI|nr:hypothetical protein PCL_10940 [Purpureocillium lilacinum]
MVRAWTLSGLGYSKGGTVRDGGHWLTALIRSRRCCHLTGTRRREKMKDGRGWFGQGPPLTGFAVLPHLSPAVAPRRPSVRQAQARGGAAGHLKTGRCRAAAPASSRRLMPPGRRSSTERARRSSNQPPPHSDHRRPHLTRSTFDRIAAPPRLSCPRTARATMVACRGQRHIIP